MATIFIGDFRGDQLHYCDDSADYIFITADSADSRWLAGGASDQLALYSENSANVIIALGFNDCIHSCVREDRNINLISTDFINTINKLVEDYKRFSFYVCAVNPIDLDYPFAGYGDNGVIPLDTLNTKIKQLNNELSNKEKCKATFIDSYNYLISTSFNTRDGVRYTKNTCESLLSYISSQLKISGGSRFKIRVEEEHASEEDINLGKPVINKDSEDCDLYWLGVGYGAGLNPFVDLPEHINAGTGDTLPNCTAYAWGRFYEILGSKPKLSTGNAEDWFDYTEDGYERSDIPAAGAVICWEGIGSKAGHVAIVEKVNSDGSIIISESGWNATYWQSSKREKDEENNLGNWGQSSSGYKFQGFIYNPKATNNGISGDYIDKSKVVSRDDYLSSSEMEINARYIWNFFGSREWSLNAVAGMLGNMETESSFSPNRCEMSKTVAGPSSDYPTASDIEDYANRYLDTHGRFPGYGIVQWTGQYSDTLPYKWENQKFIYWCNQRNLDPSDIDSQLERILWECENGAQFDDTGTQYNMTFKEFSTSEKSADYLGRVFLACYEKPANPEPDVRGKQAEEWYEFLLPYAPFVGPIFTVSKLKLDYLSATSAKASFIARKAENGYYELFKKESEHDKDYIAVDGGPLFVAADAKDNYAKVVPIECVNLTPNTSYIIKITVTENKKAEPLTETIFFNTPQNRPDVIKNIVITATDEVLPHDEFEIKVRTSESEWGYWKKNGYGYDIQLIVNGQVKKVLEISNGEPLPKKIKISKYFRYKCKIGDSIQIGIRAWTLYNKEYDSYKKLFDHDSFVKTSNSICILTKPVTAYLNID